MHLSRGSGGTKDTTGVITISRGSNGQVTGSPVTGSQPIESQQVTWVC